MSNHGFKKASKAQSKLRCALFGPSGAGKTMTSLRIAKGFQTVIPETKIAFIDSERGSASKYADRFDFDVLELEQGKKSIDDYIKAIDLAKDNGYGVLILDSLSHAWQELLEEIDNLANSKFKGNTWAAWSKGTPKQKALIESITNYPGHVIATIRSKTEWESDKDGKGGPKRVGLAPEQGKGIEYEFDFLVEITQDHLATVIKDRSGKFQDRMIKAPDEKFGSELIGWLLDGKSKEKIEADRKIEEEKKLSELIIEKKKALTDKLATCNTLTEVEAINKPWLATCIKFKFSDEIKNDGIKLIEKALTDLKKSKSSDVNSTFDNLLKKLSESSSEVALNLIQSEWLKEENYLFFVDNDKLELFEKGRDLIKAQLDTIASKKAVPESLPGKSLESAATMGMTDEQKKEILF